MPSATGRQRSWAHCRELTLRESRKARRGAICREPAIDWLVKAIEKSHFKVVGKLKVVPQFAEGWGLSARAGDLPPETMDALLSQAAELRQPTGITLPNREAARAWSWPHRQIEIVRRPRNFSPRIPKYLV
jgi:hypothetical protein